MVKNFNIFFQKKKKKSLVQCKGSLAGGYAKVGGALNCADCASKPRFAGAVPIGQRTKGFVVDPVTGQKRTVG
jgi:hypothetical protein